VAAGRRKPPMSVVRRKLDRPEQQLRLERVPCWNKRDILMFRRFAKPCSRQHYAFVGIARERRRYFLEQLNKLPLKPSCIQAAGASRSDSETDGLTMCEKCEEIDKTISRYQRILLSIGDQVTVDRTKELIADLEVRKAALHPE
jgi:hypothetical protein